eukprot:scaffold14582_cov108-Isochrysis_galbana.AAC.10
MKGRRKNLFGSTESNGSTREPMKQMVWRSRAEAVEGDARHVRSNTATVSANADRGRESATSLRYMPEPSTAATALPAGGRTYGRG